MWRTFKGALGIIVPKLNAVQYLWPLVKLTSGPMTGVSVPEFGAGC